MLGNVVKIKNKIPLNFAIKNYDGKPEFNIASLQDFSSLLIPNFAKSTPDRHNILKNTLIIRARTTDSICKEYRITGISILKASLNLLTNKFN